MRLSQGFWGTGEKGEFISRKDRISREKGNKDNNVSLFPSPPPPPPRGTSEQVPPGSVLAQKANLVSLCEQRRLWRVCTFESRLNLRHLTKTSCVGSYVVFFKPFFYTSREVYGETAQLLDRV